MIIQRYSSTALRPAYQLLTYADHIYLLIRLASGGNSGAYWFKVFDVSRAPAEDLMVAYDDPQIGISCTEPRLYGNSLLFEISADCHAASLSESVSYRRYWVQLGSLPGQTPILGSAEPGN